MTSETPRCNDSGSLHAIAGAPEYFTPFIKSTSAHYTMSINYKSPLEGYENADPLPDTRNADGKSLYNPPGPKSAAYDEFPKPIDSSNNGFDFHSQLLHYSMNDCTLNLIRSLLHAIGCIRRQVCARVT